MVIAHSVKEDTKIPVGVVLEDEGVLAQQLYDSIANTTYIRPFLLDKREALNKLEKHELDSVFIIQRNYDNTIEKGGRTNLIKSYRSDLSFTYVPLKELVISFVYEDFIRSHAAFYAQELQRTYHSEGAFNWINLVERSKEIENEQDLLQTNLIFHGKKLSEQTKSTLFNPWEIWILFTFLTTFLLFDWTIKESKLSTKQRFAFGKYSFKYYLIINGLIYTTMMLLIDFLTISLLAYFFSLSLSSTLIIAVISYRLMINMFAFLISLFFKSIYFYYIISFILFCLAVLGSGVIIPVDGIFSTYPLLIYLNPLQSTLSLDIFNHWLLLLSVCLFLWFFIRGEKYA